MRKILKFLTLIAIFLIVLCTMTGIYQETKIKKADNLTNSMQSEEKNNNQEINITKQDTRIDKIQLNTNLVAEKYKGYTVVANLKIEKLNIDTCVLEEYTKNAMDVCVTKFFGPEPNEVGNFCITGHNYITKNMFGYLYQLNIGDTLSLTDNNHGTVKYEIYNKYRAKPTQTYGLSQKTNGKREVTLVTCCNYYNERLVIKAREYNS